MKKATICGLDVGSSKLTAVLAKTQKQNIELLANECLPVCGISKGIVKDLVSLADCIQRILNRLSSKTGIKINQVLLSVNGGHISARNSFATIALSERDNCHISSADINYLRRQAKLLGLGIDEMLLHEFPQNYILDDSHNTFRPLGLLARKVRLNSYLLSASHTLIGNITTAVQQAGYEVLDTLFSGVSSSLSVISQEEKIKGVILVDLGACFSSLLFFKDGVLRDFKMISFGGNDITDDISKGLNLTWELAEEIKRTSLILSAMDSEYSDTVVIRRGDSYKTLQRRAIYESVKIRLERFMDQIKKAVDLSLWSDKMECGIVGVGGAAHLEGILEKIEHHTNMPVRLGHIKNNFSQCQHLGPQYVAALGLIYYGCDLRDSSDLRRSFIGKNYLEKTVNFVCNLYKEYF